MAKSEDARLIFMKESHSLQTLTKLLHSYIQLDSLVKLLRFFFFRIDKIQMSSFVGFKT